MEKEVQEDQESAFSIDLENFPTELLLEIFSHLQIDDLCRVGRVCSRWYSLTRYEPLWKTVDCHHLRLTSEQIGMLVDILPSYTKRLRICSFPTDPPLPNLFPNLRRRCPDLQTLLLESMVMSTRNRREIQARNLPSNVKVLSLRRCVLTSTGFFRYYTRRRRSRELHPQFQVLDCTRCLYFTNNNLNAFSRIGPFYLQELYLSGCHVTDDGLHRLANAIPEMRVLDLENTPVTGRAFEICQSFCVLEELFLAGSQVTDVELINIQPYCFSKLRVICLRRTDTGLLSHRSLISSLPTLQSVNGYPRNRVLEEIIPNDSEELCDHFITKHFRREIKV